MHPRLSLVRGAAHRKGERRGGEWPPPPEAPDLRLVQALPDACWLYDPQAARFSYVNPAYVQRWGAGAEDGGVCVERWLSRLHTDDRALVQAALERLARGESYSIEYRAVDRHGTMLWIAEETRWLGSAPDAPCQVVGISRDITASKGRELALQDEIRRKDEFLAVLMHELRTPLQAIRAAGAVLPPEQGPAARVIERQVRHLSRLVDDLGEATRITQQRVHLQLETVDLRAVVAEAVDALRAGPELRLLAPDSEVCVRADPARLAQVFNNLLHNAVKFSPAGGFVEVRITRSVREAEATVSVSDEGVGIAPEALDSVFDLFAQEASAPTRQRRGLGIGLSVVRRLVELHGGRVSVHSDGRGCGSRFDVTLPAMPPAGPRRAHRVLVVEDNADAAVSLKQLLQLDGHAVAVAADGRSGLRAAALWRPDAVILDLELPDIDGWELARCIREATSGRGPRLIALSGAGVQDRQAMRAAGFDECLAKPACPSELAAALDG